MRFNKAEYAEYYHRQMIEAGYPGKLLPFILKELEVVCSVIDIGSGSGFFSIPLTLAGHKVTAVEPSAEMINIMKNNFPVKAVSSINICNTGWYEWEGEPHDAAICVHSLYPMSDIKKAITLMKRTAGVKYIIVRNTEGMRTLSGIVRDDLGIISNRDLNSGIITVLNELTAEWRCVNIYEERKHLIKDIQHEADSIIYQLKLDKSSSENIQNIIERETENLSGAKIFNAIYSDNVYIFK